MSTYFPHLQGVANRILENEEKIKDVYTKNMRVDNVTIKLILGEQTDSPTAFR